MAQKTITYLFTVFILLMLIYPQIQKRFQIHNEGKLSGYTEKVTKDEFSAAKFFNQEFQQNRELYISRNFGFRTWFIRAYNQIDYWIFKKANAWGIVFGKDNYLFAQSYLEAHNGMTYLGEQKIDSIMQKLVFIRDDLEQKGKHMLFVFAASKAELFEDKIPNYYQKKDVIRNSESYIRKLKEYNIDFIDFNNMFIEEQSKSKYPLYPKAGIHWSYYGGFLAGDSIVSYIENKTKKDLPDIKLDTVKLMQAHGSDTDISQTMNLIFPINDVKYGYPQLSYDKTDKDSINVLIIADSFYWTIYGQGIHKNVFGENSRFWFYYNEVFPKTDEQPLNAKDLNLRNELETFDYIIFLTQEGKLHTFGWGFLEAYYNTFFSQSIIE